MTKVRKAWENLKISGWERSKIPTDIFGQFKQKFWPYVKTYLEGLSAWEEDKVVIARYYNARDALKYNKLLDVYGNWYFSPEFGKHPLSGFTAVRRKHEGYDHDHGVKNCPIVLDLGLPSVQQGKAIWGQNYVVLPDGSHGPLKSSVASRAAKVEFLRASGQREDGDYGY